MKGDIINICKVLHIVILGFCTVFLLTIVVSVLLRYKDSDYLFGIFKLSLHQ